MNIEELLNEIQAALDNARIESGKFLTKGNAAAGTRLRKYMQDIKNTAQAIRNEVTNVKNENKN